MSERLMTPGPSAIPRIAASSVRRTELITRLDSLAPLTVVHGLSGTGKTTLVAKWATERRAAGDLVWWFNAMDLADPALVVQALRTRPAIVGTTVIVVLDDAHRLTCTEAQTALIDALVHAADSHLVICSRIAHDLVQLAKAVMLETTLISGARLNLIPAQIPEFAYSWGHDVGAVQTRELYDAYGGWLGILRRALDHAHPEHDRTGLLAAKRLPAR